MGKVQVCDIDKKERYEMIGDFFDLVGELSSKKDIITFFVGLLTPSEMIIFGRRIRIAQMLLEGMSYDAIAQKLKTSPTTVNAVAKWLYADNQNVSQHITRQIKRKKGKKHRSKNSYYKDILSPYGQLRIIKDILDR